MKNWKRLLFVVLAIVGLMLTLHINNALAIIEEDCPEWVQPCIGRLELSDMGEFNPDGSFNWNGPEAGAQTFDGSMPDPFKDFDTSGGTFTIRRYPAGVRDPQVRIVSDVFGEATFAPVVWKSTEADPANGIPASYFGDVQAYGSCGQDGGYMMNNEECAATYPQYAEVQGNDCQMQPEYCGDLDGVSLCGQWNPNGPTDCSGGPTTQQPCTNLGICQDTPILGWNPANPTMNADPTVDDCCKLGQDRMEEVTKVALPFSSLQSIHWVEKNVDAFMEHRNNDALIVKYGLYPMNFWDYANAFQYFRPDFNAHFPVNILPDANTVQTIRYTLTDGRIFEKKFNITDVTPMPTVEATKEVIGDDDKVTIHLKERKIGLKLTWNDPPFKTIMRPGLQLRVGVSASEFDFDDYTIGHVPSNMEIFYWIDVPAQMHKLLIPDVEWQFLKDKLIAAGHTEAVVTIVYRTIEENDEFGTTYMNRGHSEPIFLPLQ